MQAKYGSDILVIGVAGKGDDASYESFVATGGVDGFEHGIDTTGGVWLTYGVSTQPAVVFLNDDGTFTTHNGAIGIDGLTEGVEALLAG